ncbi:hypothetical protein JRF84_25150 [Methylobacterium organophilum]|uniref:hypothetical protein n=1 Tax=Methylobacterium organophilum TaxID=410 RepID=UPI0019CFC502|nr:hypothetical protein [Methylobacterium organophilum]MBN6822855.1 hypothetical protein [Methylobacterium organophilum]
MPDDHDAITEAADALIAAGYDLKPWGDDLSLWLVDGESLTDGELMAKAIRNGLMEPPSDRLQ